jgi:ATP-dependent Clp protease adaptor protein ClpS
MAGERTDGKQGTDVGILEKPARKVKEPEQYRVLLHNDDYTPMDFVVVLLETVFNKGPAEAYRIMLKVHMEGVGIAGIYPYEMAETKVEQVHDEARAGGYPLRASLEEA